ncbi:MAG TPA: hypothetical protein VGI22_18965 [Xanthobacteraceae bacterium]|jgi:hypothetical protein
MTMMSKPDLYAGISARQCPTACTPERCVITGEDICSHPFKGGLQPHYMSDPGILDRRRLARKVINRDSAA